MLIEFQNTRDDLLELSASATRAIVRRKAGRGVFVGLIFGVAVVAVLFITDAFGSKLGLKSLDGLIALASMSMLFLTLPLVQIVIGQKKLGSARQWFSLLLQNVVYLCLLFVVIANPQFQWSALRPHYLWFGLVVLAGIWLIQFQSRLFRAAWQGQPSLNRMKTVDISADGVTVSDSVCRLQYLWTGFVRWEETGRLFLLFVGASEGFMFPKSAFHGEEELAAFRALARAIPSAGSMGFPVSARQTVDSVGASTSR